MSKRDSYSSVGGFEIKLGLLRDFKSKIKVNLESGIILHFKVSNYPSGAVVALVAVWHTSLALNELKTLPLPL